MSIVCPHCGLQQQPRVVTRPVDLEYDHMTLGITDDPHGKEQRFVAYDDDTYRGMWAIGKCLRYSCRHVFLLAREYKSNAWGVATIVPSADTAYLGKTPEAVKSAIGQAKKCIATGCTDAAAAMCRAALERMAKDKDAEGKWLADKLKDLRDNKKLLTGIVYDAADKVKEWGNTALHELLEKPVGEETAKKLITLTDLVARDLYITPEEIKSLGLEN